VLKISGGNLTWGTDNTGGLTLPYSGSASSAGPAFDVTNSGDGGAIRGSNGPGDYALLGDVNGYGVTAYSRASFGAGLRASHTSGNVALLASANVAAAVQHTNGNFAELGRTSGGVYGFANSSNGTGVLGEANNGSAAVGVRGKSSSGVGVYGDGPNDNWGYLGGASNGVRGVANSSNGNGVQGEAYTGSNAAGVWGISSTGYAGYFTGRVHVTGNFTAGGTKSFLIDHPLDPEHKTLRHAAIESSEVLNQYSGNVVTDENGFA
jgi:hypothetical protein